MVNSHNGILQNNENKQTTITHSNIDDSENYNIEEKIQTQVKLYEVQK